MTVRNTILLTLFYLGVYPTCDSQSRKLWGIDVTNKRVLIDSFDQKKFVKADTARYKFDIFTNYSKAYDTKNQRYVLECDTALILFNANGLIYKTIHKTYDLEGLEYNPIDGFIYCVAFKNTSYYFTKIDLSTGQLSLLKSLSDYGLTTSTLDYENGYYYIISDSKGLFKIDIKNGNKLDSNKLFTTNNCSCNEYDNETEHIATICVINSKKVMQLYNPSDRSFNTIDTIEKYGTGYFGYNAASFDQATGDWYFNLGKNIGVKNSRTNFKMDTLTTGFNRIRSIEYPGKACYHPFNIEKSYTTNPRCHGGSDGSINLQLKGARAPYSYSLNNGLWTGNNNFKSLGSGNYDIQVQDKNELCQLSVKITLIDLTEFKHLATTKDNICYGEQKGEINISTTGNNAPYFYGLNGNKLNSHNTFSQLANGYYTIYIEDNNGCRDSINKLSIHSPTALRIDSSTLSAIKCFNEHNGTLFIKPSGGTAPYNMQLDTRPFSIGKTLDSIDAGKHVFKLRDVNGCLLEDNYEWLNPDPIQLEAYVQNNPCANHSNALALLKLKNNLSTNNYQLQNINTGLHYLLNDTIKNLKNARYHFAIETIQGCRDSLIFDIKPSKELKFNKALDTTLCNGQFYTINLQTNGAKAYQTKADNGLNFNVANYSTDKAGTYFITTTDSNNCKYLDTFSIRKINTDVLHDFLMPSMALLSDTVVAVIISQPNADNNKWYCGNAKATIQSSNTYNAQWQFKDTGIYTLYLKSNYGACHFETSKNIRILTVHDSLKLERTLGYRSAMIQSFKVYANPHDGQHFSIAINLRDTAKAMLYKIDGNGGSILSEIDLGTLKEKTFMAFPSIKSEVYYLKLVVGRESRVIKVVAVM